MGEAMRTIAIVALMWALPVGAAAQDSPNGLASSGVTTSAEPQPRAMPTTSSGPPPGSQIGYIDDSTIRTQLRIRFDTAFHDANPDRAEFFYGKCGCYASLAGVTGLGHPEWWDPNAPGPAPGIPQYVNFQQLYVNGEYAVGRRFSVFGDFPLRWLQPFGPSVVGGSLFSSTSGFSDLSAGAKFALVSTDKATVTAQLRAQFPTGDAAKGLGTNHTVVETSGLFRGRVGQRGAIEGEFGELHPINGSAGVATAAQYVSGQPASHGFAGDVIYYGIGPSVEVVRKARYAIAPVVELVGWHIVNGFVTPPADTSGLNIVNLKLGVRTTMTSGASIYVGYGHALTTTDWYDNILRIEFRYALMK
jgi:hypothetical protein